jgi:predicted small lipoprotein YifL
MAYRILSVVLIALALAGCGRRGSLEAPSVAAADAAAAAAAETGKAAAPDTAAKPAKPDKPFFLDPLI